MLDRAVRGGQWSIVRFALRALRQFGSAAASARSAIRALASPGGLGDAETALAAVTALCAVGADPDEVLPLLPPGLDGDGGPFRAGDIDGVASLLGAIGAGRSQVRACTAPSWLSRRGLLAGAKAGLRGR
ncbi:hypothetical protein [Kitasatospora griseola]|uniref:hypothetical protein n=1 Tax=Kitasatospora griseola TaxID=2064 RepID=UPI001670D5BB|nr:hypothetical protein [Kitasatospora griseola]GGR00907.1 hypothetical protein GCM10010195_65940 [Kitasatospora griseola]